MLGGEIYTARGFCMAVAVIGNRTQNVAPLPGWLVTEIDPRCWVTIH